MIIYISIYIFFFFLSFFLFLFGVLDGRESEI